MPGKWYLSGSRLVVVTIDRVNSLDILKIAPI